MLENDMTIEDPVAFTAPWYVNRRYRRLTPDTFVSDTNCNESQHSPIINGQTQCILPDDPPGYLLGPMPMAPPTSRDDNVWVRFLSGSARSGSARQETVGAEGG
jgi:hypothetical protein